ncbi:MAG TPA: S8 family serine peptidase [Rhabdaerophilum sp.]|nr:S8 family serine peptidase [Rhabdaerophilum sp.]
MPHYQPKPLQEPATYSAFWHLEAIGVLSAGNHRKALWSQIGENETARLALIDTGVEFDHPYLANVEKERSVDLTGEPVPAHGLAGGLPRPFATLANPGLAGAAGRYVDALIARYRDCVPYNAVHSVGALAKGFSEHGTACAGLAIASPPKQGNPPFVPYAGVDPLGRLISITTSFENEPDRMILAFLYAAAAKADVILFPRALTPALLVKSADEPCDRPAWDVLREVILAVSKRVPVVCAAGNEAESTLTSPAALADEAAWEENGVIAVGAMSYLGFRSAYSTYGTGLTLAGPSSDMEMLTADQARIDWTDPENLVLPVEGAAIRNGLDHRSTTYCEQSLMALDLTGNLGLDRPGSSPFQQGTGSFTMFGGTSGASSIVAGVALLLQRARRAATKTPLSGPVMKRLLADTARTKDFPHTSKCILTPDYINGNQLKPKEAFGAGLVDAAAALKKLATIP